MQINSKSRAALSLLGYCYFYLQDYVNASDCYEQLTVLHPDQEQYKLYYSQALYKCGLYEESAKAASQIENAEIKLKVNKLKAAIKYAEGDMKSCTVRAFLFLPFAFVCYLPANIDYC
jgi:tetratricopeptide repeat protein 30